MGRPGDGRDDPRAQRAFAGQRGHFGQAVTQRERDVHLSRGPAVPDMQRGGHLGGRRIPRIKRPQRAVVVVIDAAVHQLRDRGQPSRTGSGFGAGAVLDRRDQLAITNRRELRIEHMCESTRARRRRPRRVDSSEMRVKGLEMRFVASLEMRACGAPI